MFHLVDCVQKVFVFQTEVPESELMEIENSSCSRILCDFRVVQDNLKQSSRSPTRGKPQDRPIVGNLAVDEHKTVAKPGDVRHRSEAESRFKVNVGEPFKTELANLVRPVRFHHFPEDGLDRTKIGYRSLMTLGPWTAVDESHGGRFSSVDGGLKLAEIVESGDRVYFPRFFGHAGPEYPVNTYDDICLDRSLRVGSL